MKKNSLFSLSAIIVYIISTMQALLFSLVLPTLSLYVAEKFNATAFYIGAFFVALALSGIIYAYVLGHYSDKMSDRRILISVGMIGGALACYSFSVANSYWSALLAGLLFFSLAFASIAQVFAYARDFSEQYFNREQLVLFNSILRAFASFAWIGGPALSYFMLDIYGFYQHYAILSVLYIIGTIVAFIFLPKVTINKIEQKRTSDNNDTNKKVILIAVIAFSLLFACNQTYLIALPLYLTKELGVDSTWAGLLMGTAAAIEIPIMIFAGWLGTRYSLPSLLRLGALGPVFLYLGFWQADNVWLLFPLQIFNAMLIAFITGLGMTWFQDLMPGQAGKSSALFWNTTNIGNVIGAVVIALFAQWLGYRDVYVINALLAIFASILLFYVNATYCKNPKLLEAKT